MLDNKVVIFFNNFYDITYNGQEIIIIIG